MNHSESLSNIGAALAAFQGEVENADKNKGNPAFKSKYADLAEILNTVREPLSRHGLAIIQIPSFADGIAHVETMLLHKSGEFIMGLCSAPVGKQDAQGVGSAITYLRRYMAAAMCGVAQEDDDGNGAVGNSHAGQSTNNRNAQNAGAALTHGAPPPPPAPTEAEIATRKAQVAEYSQVKEEARARMLKRLKNDEAETDKFIKEMEDALKAKDAKLPEVIAALKALGA